MQKLLNDQTKDTELYSLNRNIYSEIVKNRRLRRNNNYNEYIVSKYPIYPKLTLTELEKQKQKFISRNNINPNAQLVGKIQELQYKIDNLDYCVEGTPEYNTRQDFLAYAADFVWPDANELAIRQQEEVELLALLN